MKIILHTGVHATDDDRLIRTLARNAADWRDEGVAVPGPGRYRALLSDAIHALAEGSAGPEAREVLLETILTEDPDRVSRMLLSNKNFFGVPRVALKGGILYARAEERIGAMKELFAGDEIEVFMGLRDPASFLPALFAEAPQDDAGAFLDGLDPDAMRWSDLVHRLRAAHPDVALTLWCNEDTPFVWGEVIRAMAGLSGDRPVRGAFDILSEIMAPEGMERFRAYLAARPGISETATRKVMAAFLDKYARPEAMEEELDMPGWSEARVEAMTRAYEADVDALAGVPGVRVIAP